MNSTTIVLNSGNDMTTAMGILSDLPSDGSAQVTFAKHRKNRSLAQNRLSHMHYAQIGAQMHETPAQVKGRCKLEYGIPILLRETQSFALGWQAIEAKLSYEEKIEAVKLVDVTSVLTTPQFSQYIEEYMMEHEAQGIILNHPEDLFWAAMR